MKKLLSLLSVLIISGTAIPTTIAASPYQKEKNIRLNRIKRNINLQKLNNLINIKNTLSEKIKDMGKKVNEECQLMILLEYDLTIKLQELGNYLKEDLSESIKNINMNENNLKQSIKDIGKNIKTFGTKMQEIGELVKQITNDLIKSFINVYELGDGSISQGLVLEKIGEIIDLYQNENLNTNDISKIKNDIHTIGYNINIIGVKLTFNEAIKYYPDVLPGLKDYRMILKPWLTNELNGYVLGNNVKKIRTKLENIQINNNQISNQNINDLGQNIEYLGKEMENISLILQQGYKSTKSFGLSLVELGKFIKLL